MGDFHSVLTFAGILAAFIVITLILGSQERKRTRSKLAAIMSTTGRDLRSMTSHGTIWTLNRSFV